MTLFWTHWQQSSKVEYIFSKLPQRDIYLICQQIYLFNINFKAFIKAAVFLEVLVDMKIEAWRYRSIKLCGFTKNAGWIFHQIFWLAKHLKVLHANLVKWACTNMKLRAFKYSKQTYYSITHTRSSVFLLFSGNIMHYRLHWRFPVFIIKCASIVDFSLELMNCLSMLSYYVCSFNCHILDTLKNYCKSGMCTGI